MMAVILGSSEYAWLAFIALAAAVCVMTSVFIVNYQSREKMQNAFELEKLRIHSADKVDERSSTVKRDVELGRLASQREIEFKRIDSGMLDLQTAERHQAEREG